VTGKTFSKGVDFPAQGFYHWTAITELFASLSQSASSAPRCGCPRLFSFPSRGGSWLWWCSD